MRCQLHTEPIPPSTRLRKSVPKDLEAVILSCLQKDARNRPADARALAERLDACKDAGKWTAEELSTWWEKNAPEVMVRSTEDGPEVENEPTKSVIVTGADISASGQRQEN